MFTVCPRLILNFSHQCPYRFVDIFFREERLPIAEGWKRSDVPITQALLNSYSDIISDNSDWQGPTQNCSELVFTPDGSILN